MSNLEKSNTKKNVYLVVNKKSGNGKGEELITKAKELCDELGFNFKDFPIDEAEKAVSEAQKNKALVVAAGGDGTLRAVAQLVHSTELDMAIVPLGTFNYFARGNDIPEDMDEALKSALTNTAKPVQIGKVNDQVFLINASLGVYAASIIEREKEKKRFGRSRFIAIWATIYTFFSRSRVIRIKIKTEDEEITRQTTTLFIGNSAMQFENMQMDVCECIAKDSFAVVILKKVTKLDLLRIVVRGVFKTLDREKRMESFCSADFEIEQNRSRRSIALDGELMSMKAPFKVQCLPKGLKLVVP